MRRSRAQLICEDCAAELMLSPKVDGNLAAARSICLFLDLCEDRLDGSIDCYMEVLRYVIGRMKKLDGPEGRA